MPATVKRSIELLGLCLVAWVLSTSREIVTPILMAFFLAILILPVYRRLRGWKFPEALAIFCAILAAAAVLAGVIWFFSFQVRNLLSDIPEIQNNLNNHCLRISGWINANTNFSTQQQLD